MKILFIFRRFNDLDHIAPLADLIANNFDCKIYILSNLSLIVPSTDSILSIY